MKRLINRINLKKYINEKDLAVSKHFYDSIEEWLKYELDVMTQRAVDNNRTTIMKKDI